MNINVIIDRLSKIPRNQRLGIYSVLYILFLVLYVSVLYMPLSTEKSNLGSKQNNLITERSKIEDRVKNKKLYEMELQQLVSDLKLALKELPEDREIPGLLKGISALGKKVGLEVRRFTVLPENMREYVAEVPVSLEVQGSYHEVAMFFDRLSKMNRIVYISEIEMAEPEERGGKVYLTVTGNAVTFRFLTDEEIAANQKAQERGKGKAKRKRGGK
ncbi:MAG: type 4a pilus biogenesis protein PilO [Myxococcota bacterium]|nr:type 4a pilus biogenesis protein PilO [Myxococcota bacterium]